MTSYEQTPYNSARHEAEKSHHLFERWASKDIAEDQPQNGRANVRARSASDCGIFRAEPEKADSQVVASVR